MSFERRKIRIGHITSNKMQKTVVVAVVWRQRHRLYKKAVRRITKFKAHDPEGRCQVGDLVRIRETRPLSKTKRWRVVEILERKEVVEPLPAEAPIAVAQTPQVQEVTTSEPLVLAEGAGAVAPQTEAPEPQAEAAAPPKDTTPAAAASPEAPKAAREASQSPKRRSSRQGGDKKKESK